MMRQPVYAGAGMWNFVGDSSRLENQVIKLSLSESGIRISSSQFPAGKRLPLRSICFQYLLHLLNNDFLSFLNYKTGLIIFILCCVNAYLPKTEAQSITPELLRFFIDDLNEIKRLDCIDTSLYTASTSEYGGCEESVMNCFFSEMEVVRHESKIKQCTNNESVNTLLRNAKPYKNASHVMKANCKQCEQYEERNFTEFVENFKILVQHLFKNMS
ncbi:interleukin-15 isoform X2 [Alligator sinensis]|uniref:Interleukin n=1 Tax=Alligator sinensis TaxID=38654 RepID=A0A3Q0H613_ALLSI|nr:interleukin-15 isoform X2 [Alligator sinensis]